MRAILAQLQGKAPQRGLLRPAPKLLWVDKLIEGSQGVGGKSLIYVRLLVQRPSSNVAEGQRQKWIKNKECGDNCMRRVKKADGKKLGWTAEVFFFLIL